MLSTCTASHSVTVAEEDGKIVAGHCDCIAGLGETCSHVASLLFAVESGVRIRDSMTVTQKKEWCEGTPVQDINFVGKKRSAAKVSSLDFRPSPSPTPAPFPVNSPSQSIRAPSMTPCPAHKSATTPTPPSTPHRSKSPTLVWEKTPSHDDTMAFLGMLASRKTKPAVLSLIDPYSSQYVPKSLDSSLPACLSQIFQSEYACLNYCELLSIASDYKIMTHGV